MGSCSEGVHRWSPERTVALYFNLFDVNMTPHNTQRTKKYYALSLAAVA
jgi:hypothetical protein